MGKATVIDVDIRIALRQVVIKLDLGKHGITATRVGSHPLQAGGAMVLKFIRTACDDIKKMSRWSSDTFLIYIHDQITEYSEGWAQKNVYSKVLFQSGRSVHINMNIIYNQKKK